MVSQDKHNGNCNGVHNLSTNICVPSKTKDTGTMVKHISYDFKCKFNSPTCNSNQKWNNDKCQCECRKCRICKKE